MENQVNLTNENVDFSQAGKVVINDNNLVNNLLNNQTETLDSLSNQISGIDISKIHIDAFGRTVIEDSVFQSKIKDSLSSGVNRININCYGC